MADALLIEIYASQIAEVASSDVYAFVTSNFRDFSVPNGDRRQPHPDLAGLFDGTRSRFAHQVEGLHEVLLEYACEHAAARRVTTAPIYTWRNGAPGVIWQRRGVLTAHAAPGPKWGCTWPCYDWSPGSWRGAAVAATAASSAAARLSGVTVTGFVELG